ncbi:hypothetical protein M407DRAFT_225539 [Tulasnella calospora MUT 4182]|uniref:Uncharacterized protein n=1 Tax=Tulasnella calospora MUT 4182 TaxID=1051891 RepID=A0A0C3PUE3_9AGAM|nr:hypothetical protein M407DRAFT_225539 [Tulasnella calospora MUT 4182]
MPPDGWFAALIRFIKNVSWRVWEAAKVLASGISHAARIAVKAAKTVWRWWNAVPGWIRWPVHGVGIMFIVYLILGFGTGGVVGGTIAAGIHSGIGNVAAGSPFAIMQSLAAKGILWKAMTGFGALAGEAVSEVLAGDLAPLNLTKTTPAVLPLRRLLVVWRASSERRSTNTGNSGKPESLAGSGLGIYLILGIGPAGVAAGLAAGIQSSIGNVVAWSAFAIMQALGAKAILGWLLPLLGAAGAVGLRELIAFICSASATAQGKAGIVLFGSCPFRYFET